MLDKLDQYFTPPNVALELLKQAQFIDPINCIDPTCGSGNLLSAAKSIYGSTQLIGIDRDREVINKLRKEKPDWLLSVADLNNANSYSKASAISKIDICDALLLNPPFSQLKNKFVSIKYAGEKFNGSIAMSYLVKSLDLFTPKQGALVIAPESLLHSQLDEFGRVLLEKSFELNVIGDLENKTFKGARVHSTVFRLIPRVKHECPKALFVSPKKKITAIAERGGVQVHKVRQENSERGLPFIHTTSLKSINCSGSFNHYRTNLLAKGRVSGKMILMPRVGLPKAEFTKIYNFDSQVQLSDCLFAISCDSSEKLRMVLDRIKANWVSFEQLYRGTGARYVTKSKLIRWFALQSVHLDFVE